MSEQETTTATTTATAKKTSLYTPDIIAAMSKLAPLNWESAQVFAEKNGLKARGVVASCKRNKIEYKRQEKVTKTGTPVISKADLVTQIAEKFKINIEKLDGLDKATKTALENLLT